MSGNILDEACPMCDADITYGAAHVYWCDGYSEPVRAKVNVCPQCEHVWDPNG